MKTQDSHLFIHGVSDMTLKMLTPLEDMSLMRKMM